MLSTSPVEYLDEVTDSPACDSIVTAAGPVDAAAARDNIDQIALLESCDEGSSLVVTGRPTLAKRSPQLPCSPGRTMCVSDSSPRPRDALRDRARRPSSARALQARPVHQEGHPSGKCVFDRSSRAGVSPVCNVGRSWPTPTPAFTDIGFSRAFSNSSKLTF